MDKQLKDQYEIAYSSLTAIKMLQAMAIASDGNLDKQYNLVEFAVLLNCFISKLETAMTELEQGLYAS